MVNMPHYRNDRRSRLQIFFLIFKGFQTFFYLFLFHIADNNVDSQFVRKQQHRILIHILVYIGHYTHFHQSHNDLGNRYLNLFGESRNRNWNINHGCSCWDYGFLYFRFRCILRLALLLGTYFLFQGTRWLRLSIFLSAPFQLCEFIPFLIFIFRLIRFFMGCRLFKNRFHFLIFSLRPSGFVIPPLRSSTVSLNTVSFLTFAAVSCIPVIPIVSVVFARRPFFISFFRFFLRSSRRRSLLPFFSRNPLFFMNFRCLFNDL